jgi:HdeA/HdeB family protein
MWSRVFRYTTAMTVVVATLSEIINISPFPCPTEMTVKLRLLLTTLFLFVQIPTMQAQVTVDVAKITCQQLVMEELPWTQKDVVLWLSGYYNGKRNNTIVEPETVKKDEQKVTSYCYQHRETTVMDAVKNVLGFDK